MKNLRFLIFLAFLFPPSLLGSAYVYKNGDVTITVDIFKVDSSSTSAWDGVGIPRYKILPLAGAGDLVICTDGWPGDPGIDTSLYMTKNLDSSEIWTIKATISTNNATHAHYSIYNDTIYAAVIANSSEAKLYAFYAGGSTIGSPLFSYDFQTDASFFNLNDSLYVLGHLHLPSGDSVVGISRGGGGSSARTWVSTNNGVTWDTVGHAAGMYAYRFGVISYRNSASVIIDSSDWCVQWWDYDRANGTWTKNGDNALDGHGTYYRAFSGNRVKDTFQFVIFTVDAAIDTLLYGWKTQGRSTWTEGAFPLSAISPSVAYNTLEAIDASGRMALFYTRRYQDTDDSIGCYMKYWEWSDSAWSPEYRISLPDQGGFYKLFGAQIVPASHGDVAYIAYPYDSAGMHYAGLARIKFDSTSSSTSKRALRIRK